MSGSIACVQQQCFCRKEGRELEPNDPIIMFYNWITGRNCLAAAWREWTLKVEFCLLRFAKGQQSRSLCLVSLVSVTVGNLY